VTQVHNMCVTLLPCCQLMANSLNLLPVWQTAGPQGPEGIAVSLKCACDDESWRCTLCARRILAPGTSQSRHHQQGYCSRLHGQIHVIGFNMYVCTL
jgi:hypothetical protein